MRVITLKFVNEDATPRVQELALASMESVAPIMDWYGAYCAGDRYEVFINGRPIGKGINGEFVSPVIQGSCQ